MDSNRVALYKNLVRMIARKGKTMDKAMYALNELNSKDWNIKCVSPITKEVIKESFK